MIESCNFTIHSPIPAMTQLRSSDEIYTQSWLDALGECERTLERRDYERALQVKSLDDFRSQLQKLHAEYPQELSDAAVGLIGQTLDHYETFARNFVNMMANPVDTSMMWGLLCLVFKLALGSTGSVSPLRRITRWLKKIGDELRDSNNHRKRITDVENIKRETVEVNREIVYLRLNIIMTIRTKGQGGESPFKECSWEPLDATHDTFYQSISEALKRIEKVAQMAQMAEIAEMAERHARAMHEISILQGILALQDNRQENETIPCNTLPVAENRQFYGRQDIIQQLEGHLVPADTSSRLSSIALYGLGGIGKTQIALSYAHQKLEDLDAVFWISAESTYSIQKSFSHVALDALKLSRASAQAYQENMVLVLDWLQKTTAKWLLIFDNVEDHSVLDSCWPVSKHGAVLVTTRNALVPTIPIDKGLEVDEFGIDEGAEFLLHMTPKRRIMKNELEAARGVAKELGGLPLALNQMAALINARNYSIDGFHELYSKYKQHLHKEKKCGWKYVGYKHGLNTVWEISFTSLGDRARACLGVLSFLSADSVPTNVFVTEPTKLPNIFAFCEDELCLGEAIEELTCHALVRKNIEKDSFRIHRLVQAEYRARMDSPQEDFEATIKLLLQKIPSQRSSRFDDDEWILYERYIPQVLALAKNYNESQAREKPLKPNMEFVRLLTNSSNAIHDNDTMHVVPEMLQTADTAFHKCPNQEQDRLSWALLQYLKCMHHFCTSEFARSEREMTECLDIRLESLPHDDLLVALAYNGLGMAAGTQEHYDEGLEWLLKAKKVYEGPAGEFPTRKLVWGYNISRNYYCMGRYKEAETTLNEALATADRLQSWYMQVYGHLTFASLRTRTGSLDDAKHHVDIAKKLLETSGSAARFSWLSSYCAYRAGDIATKQGRTNEAIEETEKSTVIGKFVKVPTGILARCVHAYAKALVTDPKRQEDSEKQRVEAKRLRASLPNGGGDLDDESDEAFERLVKMDHR